MEIFAEVCTYRQHLQKSKSKQFLKTANADLSFDPIIIMQSNKKNAFLGRASSR
jgi:hypothetical protein